MPNRKGFTLLEMLIVIAIGAILSGIVVVAFSQVQGAYATRGAQTNLMSMTSQARSFAVERGEQIRLVLSVEDNRAQILRVDDAGNDEILNSIEFGQEFAVSMRVLGPTTITYGPRGSRVVNTDRVEVTFTRGQRNRSVEIIGLGQARGGD